MNREATENLRLDRRLLNRRGWISKAERENELAALPDVSEKIAPPDDEGPADGSPGSAPEGD
jgi:hypothetical protein